MFAKFTKFINFIKKAYGKVEAFFTSPQKVFYLALAVGAVCTALMSSFPSNIYPDTANVYARFAREIGNFNWSEGIVARVPMFNIVLAGLLAMTGIEAVTALAIIAGIFYCATCFPLRRFLERYVSPLQAAWGCIFYITAPILIRFACAPLLESTRIFFLIAAIWLFFETMERPDWKKGMLFGLSCGFLMVSRGEGLPAGLALLGGFLPWALIFCRRISFKKQAVAWALSIAFTMLACSPFCAMNYSKTGYFVPDMRAVEIVKRACTEKSTEKHNNKAVEAEQKKSQAQLAEEKLNADKHARFFARAGVKKFTSDLLMGCYERYFVLAVLGLLVFIWQKKMKWDYLMISGMAVMHFAVYLTIVSDFRYYLFLIPLYMMFTITGAAFICNLLKKYLPTPLFAFCALYCGLTMYDQVKEGIDCGTAHWGREYREIGKYVEQYGKEHFPGRKIRVLDRDVPEVVYWSKAFHVNGYEERDINHATAKDFDLIVCHPNACEIFDARDDIERVPNTPHPHRALIYRYTSKQSDK